MNASVKPAAQQAEPSSRQWPFAINLRQWLRVGLANLLGLLSLIIGILAGIYGWYTLDVLVENRGQLSPGEVWNFLTKVQPPSILLAPAMIGVGAVIFLFFRKDKAGSPFLMRLAATLVAAGIGNILALPITRTNLPELMQINIQTIWDADPDHPFMLLTVEAISAAAALLLALVYRRIAPMPGASRIPRRSLAQVRWLVVGIVLVFLTGWTTFQMLDRTGARLSLQEMVDFSIDFGESLPLYAVWGTMAALVYCVPRANSAFGTLKLPRIFIFLVCGVGILLGYSSGVLSWRTNWIIVGVPLIVLLVPVQRVLCSPRPCVTTG